MFDDKIRSSFMILVFELGGPFVSPVRKNHPTGSGTFNRNRFAMALLHGSSARFL